MPSTACALRISPAFTFNSGLTKISANGATIASGLSCTPASRAKTDGSPPRAGSCTRARPVCAVSSWNVAVWTPVPRRRCRHIVPPTGAKGMNLAFADVHHLSAAFDAFYRRNDTSKLHSYSRTCLQRIWKAQRFSWVDDVAAALFSGGFSVRPQAAVGRACVRHRIPRRRYLFGGKLCRAPARCRLGRVRRTVK